MTKYRKLNDKEINGLKARGCSAESWESISLCEGASVENISGCRFSGRVEIGRGVTIRNGGGVVGNCRIGDDVLIENTDEIVCRRESLFGGGVAVAAVNENGGRSVTICRGLTAQTAYMAAMYRHLPQTVAALASLARARAEGARSALCTIGRGARIAGCGALRECCVGEAAELDGADILQNVTVESSAEYPSFVGRGVKCYDSIVSRGARIDNGAFLERCFAGEGVCMDKGFTASDTLAFACSHLENGEAASLFAGPFSVSRHKASLLIAGFCSFFNAGSGCNHSNHLFKTGPVHEVLYRRGVKLASNSYIMSPAAEGIFTVVLGRHESHHDTSDFPYSYLVEEDGKSWLLPGCSLMSSGVVRDVNKWPARDTRRGGGRDLICYDRFNPFEGEAVRRAISRIGAMTAREANVYMFQGVRIKAAFMRRGLSLYESALAATVGAVLSVPCEASAEGRGPWVDMAGMLAPRSVAEPLADRVGRGAFGSLEELEAEFAAIHSRYAAYARGWALGVLAERLGHEPAPEDISRAVEEGAAAAGRLDRLAASDAAGDVSASMAVGYGIDTEDEAVRLADFRAVHGLGEDVKL